ncbi:MAG TPA: hypothetical protein VFC74_04720 [Oscillospiraceae bacterium]|nr:hypothetical protein [Oscillospiraceae bacterium]
MKCPLCTSIDIGKVGTGQYYCWNCLLEFTMTSKNEFTAYYVDEEGTLVNLSEMVQNNQLMEETVLG